MFRTSRSIATWAVLSLAALGPGCATDAADLVLNEFVASNSTGITDESGAFPDWVELYNPTNAEISLDGWYLSDDLGNPMRHALPATWSIGAGGFLVLFADGDIDQGDDHLPFRLSAAGEDVVLSYGDPGSNQIVDGTTYGLQDTDGAMAKIPDATGDWTATGTPTPGDFNAAEEAEDGS